MTLTTEEIDLLLEGLDSIIRDRKGLAGFIQNLAANFIDEDMKRRALRDAEEVEREILTKEAPIAHLKSRLYTERSAVLEDSVKRQVSNIFSSRSRSKVKGKDNLNPEAT